ncbi:MAG: 3-dehydroquinate dehydratase, partial [Thermotoga sp.]
MKVFLVGMMGSGKSTIGKLLSNILGYRFIDMDEEIEKSEGRRIRDIFKRRGEKYFRKLEKKLLKEISRRRENLIVATGGGVIKDQENRKILKEHKTIFLMVEPGELLKRVKVDNRPLLSEGKNRIFDIWKQRERYYKLFTTVESTGLNVWETCAKVLYKVLERERLSIMDSVHKVLIERKALENLKGDVVFTTRSVQKIYGEFLGNSYIFPDGESVKDMKYVLEAYKILCDIGFSRSQVVTGVGGGALTDFTGFVASTFKRGTKLFLYPTTLLAQVDASIGGKNSVNFEGVKNLLGTFKMPDLVVIDPLAPLSMGDKRFKEGIIEAFKMSLISGKGLNCFNNELLMRRLTSVEKIIEFSVKEKLRIVEED